MEQEDERKNIEEATQERTKITLRRFISFIRLDYISLAMWLQSWWFFALSFCCIALYKSFAIRCSCKLQHTEKNISFLVCIEYIFILFSWALFIVSKQQKGTCEKYSCFRWFNFLLVLRSYISSNKYAARLKLSGGGRIESKTFKQNNALLSRVAAKTHCRRGSLLCTWIHTQTQANVEKKWTLNPSDKHSFHATEKRSDQTK